MRVARPQWLERRRRRVVDPFTRAANGELDTIRPHTYEVSDQLRQRLWGEVEAMVVRLMPGAVDAYTGDFLDEWIDARTEQVVQQLQHERDEQKAVGEALIGLAREEVARRQAAYRADLDRVHLAREARDETYRRLTGKGEVGPFIELPQQPESSDVRSTLGRMDAGPDWDSDPDAGSDDELPGAPSNDAEPNRHPAGDLATPINSTHLQPGSIVDLTTSAQEAEETEEGHP
jgi:hypothetical protein